MKTELNVKVLKDGLNKLNIIRGKKKSVEVLDNFKFEVKYGIIYISSTNLSSSLIIELEPNVWIDSEDGSCLINLKDFINNIKSLKNKSYISVETEGTKISISSDNTNFSMNTKTTEDYPQIEYKNPEYTDIHLPHNFNKLIKNVSYAALDDNEIDYNISLKTIKFQFKNDIMRLVALDGYRISYSEYNMNQGGGFEELNGLLLYKTELEKVIKIFPNHSPLCMKDEKDYVIFHMDNEDMIMKINKPDMEVSITIDYNRFIPPYDISVSVNRKSFLDSLKMFKKDDSLFIKIENNIKMKSFYYDKDGDKQERNISLDFIKSNLTEEIKSAINPKYLIESLESSDEKNINLLWNAKNEPIAIQNESKTHFNLIMPLRINEEW